MSQQFGNNILFGIALQQGAGASDHLKLAAGYGEKVTTDSDFNYFPATGVGFAPVKVQDALPSETGGQAFTSGVYPVGSWGEGPLSIIPRFSNRLGWLLYAALGDVESVADTKIENTTELGGTEGGDTDINTHIFRPYVSDKLFTPWISIRRLLPHTTAGERPGEVYQDGRIRSLTFAGGAGGPVGLDLDMVARTSQSDYVFEVNPGWTATYDTWADFAALSCSGYFKINATEFGVAAMSLTVINNVLGARQAMKVGSMSPMDFPVLTRAVTVNATIFLEDYDFYVSQFAGTEVDFSGSTGENVACQVYNADVDMGLATSTYITGTEPNELRVVSNQNADNVAWTIAPLQVAPNRQVMLQANGTFLAAGTSEYPILVFLQNGQADYALP